MWGVFELKDRIHVIPCDRRGDMLPPHIADDRCPCRPETVDVGEDDRLIMSHHEIQKKETVR